MSNRFEFYEIVVVVDTTDARLTPVVGEEGTILGMSQDDKSGRWGYAVSITSTDVVWDCDEQQLESTGKRRTRSDFYSGGSVKVEVDQNTGRGSITKSNQP